jgi:hypothetical protein
VRPLLLLLLVGCQHAPTAPIILATKTPAPRIRASFYDQLERYWKPLQISKNKIQVPPGNRVIRVQSEYGTDIRTRRREGRAQYDCSNFHEDAVTSAAVRDTCMNSMMWAARTREPEPLLRPIGRGNGCSAELSVKVDQTKELELIFVEEDDGTCTLEWPRCR